MQSSLLPILVYLAAAAVAVPLFMRLGLGAILAYVVVGAAIGPNGFAIVSNDIAAADWTELGIAMLLFVIGLELKPKSLLAMRRTVFGLGGLQLLCTAACFFLLLWSFTDKSLWAMAILSFGLALSSTAVAVQLLLDRGDLARPYGRKAFGILLFQDLAMVPLLAIVAAIAPSQAIAASKGQSLLLAFAAVIGTLLAGRYLLRPMLRVAASAKSHEALLMAALVLVAGISYGFHKAGLPGPLGAFLAGILLAESEFRHQLEADIEPFRGLLLGLFFAAVGMTIDGKWLLNNALPVLGAALVIISVKGTVTALLTRAFTNDWRVGINTALAIAPGGEFSFVLLSMAGAAGLLKEETRQLAISAITLTMLLSPFLIKLTTLVNRTKPGGEALPEFTPGDDAPPTVIVLGFGRVGKVLLRFLREHGHKPIVLDRNAELVRRGFAGGHRVYFGDGSRIDVLRAIGAEQAQLVAIAFDDPQPSILCTQRIKQAFPNLKVLARARHRSHAVALIEAGADYVVRETLEAALTLGSESLSALGIHHDAALKAADDFRAADDEYFRNALAAERHKP
jgi:glutathione-regulated potassium-efflux system protein KefB